MPAPYNPRKISDHDLRALRRSLRRFGTVEPIVLNKRTGRIVGGHMRVRAAQAEGIDKLPVVYVNLDETAERQLNLALNRIHGEFDPELLSGVLADLKVLGEDVELTGFTDAELDDILGVAPKEGKTDPDAVPESVEKRTEPGDLWLLNEHRLFCGDATGENNVQMVKGSEEAVALITDPPYGIRVDHGWRDGVKNRKPSPRSGQIHNDDRTDWRQVYSLVGARVLYVWHSALFGDVVKEGIEASGYEVRQQLVWVKRIHALGRAAYHWRHETCWYAVRTGEGSGWKGGRKQTTVWEYASPIMTTSPGGEATVHPTQKPTELFEIPIRNHTSEGEVIVDAFLGSGTALIAAERLGRRCFALELDPRFCDVSVTRWEAFTGRKAEHVKGGSR